MSVPTVGATITLEDLEGDPYPVYARLRDEEPVSWVEAVGLWLVTRWDDVVTVDKSPELFTAETEPSTLNRTFGKNLLGSEGAYHDRVRAIIDSAVARPSTPVYAELSDIVQVHVHRCLSGQESPARALQSAASEIDALLARTGLTARSRAAREAHPDG